MGSLCARICPPAPRYRHWTTGEPCLASTLTEHGEVEQVTVLCAPLGSVTTAAKTVAFATLASLKLAYTVRLTGEEPPPRRIAGHWCAMPMPKKKPVHFPACMLVSLRFPLLESHVLPSDASYTPPVVYAGFPKHDP